MYEKASTYRKEKWSECSEGLLNTLDDKMVDVVCLG